MAFKLGVLLVHGMGNQDAGFADARRLSQPRQLARLERRRGSGVAEG